MSGQETCSDMQFDSSPNSGESNTCNSLSQIHAYVHKSSLMQYELTCGLRVILTRAVDTT